MSTLEIPIIYIKGKKAHIKALGTLKPIGSAIKIAKKLKDKFGAQLIHVVDLDALNGKRTNYDIYDHLTFIMYVEVEVRPEPAMIKPLLAVNARVVVPLSSGLDLSQFAEKKRLLIGKITPRYKGSLEDVHDIYLDGESESLVKEMIKSGKRVIVNKGQNKGVEAVFGRIYEPEL